MASEANIEAGNRLKEYGLSWFSFQSERDWVTGTILCCSDCKKPIGIVQIINNGTSHVTGVSATCQECLSLWEAKGFLDKGPLTDEEKEQAKIVVRHALGKVNA